MMADGYQMAEEDQEDGASTSESDDFMIIT